MSATDHFMPSTKCQPRRSMLLLLVIPVLIFRGAMVQLLCPAGLWEDPDGYAEVASNVVHYHTFALRRTNILPNGARYTTPYPPSQPTAGRPPLYPLLLAASRFGSDRITAAFIFGALNAMFGAATVVAAYLLARAWNLSMGTSIIAAGAVVLDPILIVYSGQIMTETLAAFLAVAALLAVTHCARGDSIRSALIAGLLMGLCILCRPEFLVWFVGVAVVFPFAATGGRRLRRLIVCIASVAVVLSPWAIRNARVFGSPIIATTHGGFTLLLANNPSFYEYLRNAPWGTVWSGSEVYEKYERLRESKVRWQAAPPNTSSVPAAIVDEVAVDREAYRQAFDNIRNEPAMFAYSCLVRIGRLWAVLPHQTSVGESPSRRGLRYSVAIWYLAEYFLAAVGAWTLGRKLLAPPWLWSMLLVGSFTLVHAFYWTNMRMRAPLVVVVALLAAVGVARLAARRASVTPLPETA